MLQYYALSEPEEVMTRLNTSDHHTGRSIHGTQTVERSESGCVTQQRPCHLSVSSAMWQVDCFVYWTGLPVDISVCQGQAAGCYTCRMQAADIADAYIYRSDRSCTENKAVGRTSCHKRRNTVVLITHNPKSVDHRVLCIHDQLTYFLFVSGREAK